jgi:predicted transcriptional regulator
VPDSDEKVAVTVRVHPDLRRRLRIAAAEQNRELQDIVAEAVSEWLTKHKF